MNLFSDEYLMHHGIEDDYLMHYGVPGMKWGVRKARGLGYRYSAALNGAAARLSRNKTRSAMYRSTAEYARKKANAIDPRRPKSSKQPKSDAERRAIRKQRLKRAAIAAGIGAAAIGGTIAVKKGYAKYANRIPQYELATLSPSTRARGGFRRKVSSAARNAASNARREAGIAGSRIKMNTYDARRKAGAAARNATARARSEAVIARGRARNVAYGAQSRVRSAASGARRQGVIARGKARNVAYGAQSRVRSAVNRVRKTPSTSRALAIQAPSTRVRGSARRRAAAAARNAYSSARSTARRAASGARSAAAGARFRASQEMKFHKNYRRVRGGYVRR